MTAMKDHTARRTIIAAALAAAGFIAATSAAWATPAAATTTLNVRSGPGTSFGVVGVLSPGQVVEVTECVSSGWCHITQSGPNGWVSSTYLTAPPSPTPPAPSPTPPPSSGGSSSDCSFGFSLGSGGPNFSINCGDPAPAPTPPAPTPPAPPPAPADNGACFYANPNFTGAESCYGVGTRNSLPAAINDTISSVRLFGSARAMLCVDANLGGYCRQIDADTPALGALIDNRASSLSVFVGPAPTPTPPPPAVPATHSTGPVALQQTFTLNLDNGVVGGSGVDIWYQAETAVSKFINPRNGAQLALGDGSNRGYAGCAAATFSTQRIPIWQAQPGTYICARTSEGRISQFRINSYTGTTMNLGYTTWAN